MSELATSWTSVLFFFVTCGCLIAGDPVEVIVDANRDAGFFNEGVNRNMGGHTHVPVGQTNDNRINRSVFGFDISGSIPAGATINSVVFEFVVTNQGGDDSDEQEPVDFDLHRLTTEWTEGTGATNQGQNSGDGATWLAADDSIPELWNSPGGDFNSAVLGSVFVNNEATYQITSTQLAETIQEFVDGNVQNFGFLMKGSSNVPGSAARVATREAGNPARMIINYTPDTAVLLGDVNLDGEVNLLDVGPFITLLTSGGFQAEADLNGDGEVDLLDVAPFIEVLTGN